jgi:hypothetical protein
MTRVVLLLAASVAVLLGGYAHGLWSNRWGNQPALEQAVARIGAVPLTIGEWQGRPLELEARHANQAGFAGYWLRRYQRSQDGAVVTVMLACGLPGPLTVHTPSACYAGAGYVQAEAPVKHVAGAGTDMAPEFWKGKFTKPEALVPVNLRLFWSWRATHGWKAPANPRWTFAGQTVLFKMYVTHEMTGADERQADAVCADFMRLLLPEVEQALAAQPEKVAAASGPSGL